MANKGVRVYSRWGDPRKQAQAEQIDEALTSKQRHQANLEAQIELAKAYGTSGDATPHGMLPGQIEAFDARAERIVGQAAPWWGKDGGGSVLSPGNHRSALLAQALPPGRSPEMRRRGQMSGGPAGSMGLGGGNGSSVFTTMQQYQPEFACVLKGTEVPHSNGTSSTIENIKIGDSVIGTNGKSGTVLKQWCSGVPDKLIRIEVWGGEVFETTVKHKWLVWKWLDKCLCGCNAPVKAGKCYVNHHHPKNGHSLKKVGGTKGNFDTIPENYEPVRKVEATELRKGDCFLVPRKFTLVDTKTPEWRARLLGYYAAEGSPVSAGGYTSKFALHAKEEHTLAQDIMDLCANAGVETHIYHEINCNGIAVLTDGRNIKTNELYAWFESHCGHGSATKRLSDEVMGWPVRLKREFLRGYIQGDGHQRWRSVNKKRGWGFEVSFSSTSDIMARQICLMAYQCGFPGRLYWEDAYVGADGSPREAKWTFEIGGGRARELANLVWAERSLASTRQAQKEHAGLRMDDDFVYIPIKKAETVTNSAGTSVYNVTVSTADHCYCIGSGVPVLTSNSPDRQMWPVHRRIANTYWKLFNKMDPTIAVIIEMYSQLPWSDFQLAGEGVDGSVKEAFEHMINETKLRTILPQLVSEWLIIGEAIPHLWFNDGLGIWDHATLHNPDQVNVVYSPFIKMDPIMEFVPDSKLRELVTNDHPQLSRLRESMPPELVARLRAGQNIPLSPVNSTFIARKLQPYDLRGTSVISRLWRALMAEDFLWTAFLATAKRAASPIKAVLLGDPTTGTIPPPSEEKKILSLLAQAEADPQSYLAYNYMIKHELWGAPERLMSINTHYDLFERMKLTALGVSKSFISGETSYASAASGLTVFLQRLKATRDYFVNEWLIPKYFLPVAVINGWIKPSKMQASGGHVRIKQSSREMMDERKYIIPTIEWAKSLDPTIDREKIDAMNALENSLGIKITDQKKYAAMGLDAEEEQKQYVEEVKFKRDLAGKDPLLQVAFGLAAPAEGGPGGGGDAGGMAVSPGIPPEAMGMPGGEPGGGGESGSGDMESLPGGEGAPPQPAGASISGAGGSDGKPPRPADSSVAAAPVEPKHWASRAISPLLHLFDSFDVNVIKDEDVEPWIHAFKDKAVEAALKAEDKDQLWEALEGWLFDENYPSAAIRELEDIVSAKLDRKAGLVDPVIATDTAAELTRFADPNRATAESVAKFAGDLDSYLLRRSKELDLNLDEGDVSFLTGVRKPK